MPTGSTLPVRLCLRSFTNDARDLPALFDLSAKDSRERLRSEYGFDLGRMVTESRNYYADAVFMASGGMKVSAIGDATFGLWSELLYESIDAQIALQRIGVPCADVADARKQLSAMTTSNPYVQALVLGKRIGGKQFARVLPDIATHFRKEFPAP